MSTETVEAVVNSGNAKLLPRDNGILSTPNGRIDLWFVEATGLWTATDWDWGQARRGSYEECIAWIRGQLAKANNRDCATA